MRQFASGTIVGTGALVNVPIGWQPDAIELVNITDGNSVEKWFTGMAAGTSVKISGGTVAPVAANALSLLAGDTVTTKGFTVGTASNVAGKTYAYTAWRGA